MSVKNFREGIRLVPVSADPLNPTEGQLQYADGIARPEGIYVFSNGVWTSTGATVDSSEPNEVFLQNSSFNGDINGWTFTEDINDTSSGPTSTSATVESINPITGAGSASLNIDSFNYNGPRSHTFETTFTLTGEVQTSSEKVTVEFDTQFAGTETPGIFNTLDVEVLESVSGTSLGTLNIVSSGNINDGPLDPLDTDLRHVIYEFNRVSSETTYILRVTVTESDNN